MNEPNTIDNIASTKTIRLNEIYEEINSFKTAIRTGPIPIAQVQNFINIIEEVNLIRNSFSTSLRSRMSNMFSSALEEAERKITSILQEINNSIIHIT